MRPIHMPLSVRGRVRWSVYNERGEREPVRVTYPDGREALLSGGYWQPNLITNLGMNAFAETAQGWVGLQSTLSQSVRLFGRVGTGSTAPAFTDTTLDNQVDCSSTAIPFDSDAVSGSEDGSSVTIHALRRVTFVMDQNRNLTEFGFGNTKGGEWVEDTDWDGNPANCSGEIGVLDTSTCMGKIVPAGSGETEKCWSWQDFNDIYVRELFRDSGGTPITISILSGKTLRIDHVYDITLDTSMQTGSFGVDEYDAANQFVSTTTVDYHARWWSSRSSSGTATENARSLAQAVILLAGNLSWNATGVALTYSTQLNPDISAGTYLGSVPNGYTMATSSGTNTWGADGVELSKSEYVAGSYERVWHMTVSPARGNVAWTGWGTRYSRITYADASVAAAGFIVAFRNDHAFTKADTHTLRWSIKLSWARG